jgi:2-polyprenyl-3-methyl-5-hydroxy-6-metoxy-1,4-benzoquinol methylase
MEPCNSHPINFDQRVSSCPACASENIQHSVFKSIAGFMSLPDVTHDKCLDCSTVFVNPRPSRFDLEQFYISQEMETKVTNEIIQSSVSRYFEAEKRLYFIENRVKPITKYLHPRAKLVDAGCGSGVFVRFMRDCGYDAIGFDLSPSSVEIGRKYLNLDDYIRLSDYQEGLSNTSTYDAITAWTVIEHLIEPTDFLRQCYQALKPKGLLLLEFPTVDSLLYEELEYAFFWVMPPYHLTLFSKSGIQKLLSRENFEILEIYPMPKNWYFSDSVARKLGVSLSRIVESHPSAREIFREIDKIFDKIALKQGKSSSIQVICRKIDRT